MPLISLTNNILKFGINKLKLCFRTRLTKYLYDQYLRGNVYYKMNHIDNSISNPEQLFTQDVNKFCDSVADLYANISKPLLSIIIYVQQLSSHMGKEIIIGMMAFILVLGYVLSRLRKPISRLVMAESKLEGEFRYINTRLITNSEEIAFYLAHKKEKFLVLKSFERLLNQLRLSNSFHFALNYIETIIGSYCVSAFGFFVLYSTLSRKIFASSSFHNRQEIFFRNGKIMLKLAESAGRMLLSFLEISKLVGLTTRLTQLTSVLRILNQDSYTKPIASDRNLISEISGESGENKLTLKPGSGRIIIEDNNIKFDRVPLVTPKGRVLIEELTFEVKPLMNVFVFGPNGCGKSSLFRILGELWPLFGGTLTKPSKDKLFYVPQRPYMTLGTFRDQVIYPDTLQDMKRKGKSDDDLLVLLEWVQLTYVFHREGWDSVKDWIDVLSGGEKQRMAMARLFYHHPQFAILDECTSAVSVDVEQDLYIRCRDLGITLFTISHRKSLRKYHEYMLFMDGQGSYEFKPIDDSNNIS